MKIIDIYEDSGGRNRRHAIVNDIDEENFTALKEMFTY